jgi:hypothetical protein
LKKPAAHFAVEYKNPRRKVASPANSIWGNLDLKSVTRQVEDETLPLTDQDAAAPAEPDHGRPAGELSAASLTSALGQITTASVAQEGPMADENTIEADLDAQTADALPTETEEPKKRRGGRRKASADTSGDEAARSSSAKPTAKRGRPKAAGRDKTARGPGRAKGSAPVEPSSASVDTAPDTAAPLDEMEDLLQLEQENQRLRKRLAEKLREENATLRKRLGLD